MKRLFITLLILAAGIIVPETILAQQRYQIGVCDWMVLKRQKLGEFKLAKELGCDGIEMDMGGLGARNSFDNKMREPESVKLFKHTADSFGIKIGAIAMSGFYGQSFAKKESWRWLIQDCLNTMDAMGADVAFLPLGGCGNNWTDSLPLRQEIVWRLHEVGEMAKARGKVIGIDTPLDAEGNIIDYSLLSHAETPGLGSKAADWFKKGGKGDITGKNPGQSLLKVTKDGGEIDAITASTITSRAFLQAVNNAYAVYMKGETDASSGASRQAEAPAEVSDTDASSSATLYAHPSDTASLNNQKGGDL